MKLRSVELEVPRVGEAAEFLERTWGLLRAGTREDACYLRGTAGHPYLVALRPGSAPVVSSVTFSGTADEVSAVEDRVRRSGAPHGRLAAVDEPGGGSGVLVQGPHGHVYRFLDSAESDARPAESDRPIQLTHVVLNSIDVPASERFAVQALGFTLSDRTRLMSFVRCNRKHHCVAYARAEASSLHHIAFEMRDLDAVMRGLGRLQDAGYVPVWGPGRHGPGNNVFGYFVAPFGAMIEYTAEVAEVDEHYKVGGPEDWQWPPGRIDHWGVSKRDALRAGAAETLFRFPAALP